MEVVLVADVAVVVAVALAVVEREHIRRAAVVRERREPRVAAVGGVAGGAGAVGLARVAQLGAGLAVAGRACRAIGAAAVGARAVREKHDRGRGGQVSDAHGR